MRKRKEARAKPRKGLDRAARKKPMIPSESTRNAQSAKPLGVTVAGLHPLFPELAHLNELTQLQMSEKRKPGRPTTVDNFLEGFRDDWLSFFERCWHEIGWSLLEIRKRRASTIEEIQSLFQPLKGKTNCHLADCFLLGSPQPAEEKELRAKRKRVGKLHDVIPRMHSERREQEFSCAIAENALKETSEEYREAIEEELRKKKGQLQELNENLQRTEAEANDLDKKVRDWETHFYCSQLLDFLCKGKYAVKPSVLANALAGSPRTGWRQSLARCAKMERPSSYVHYPYGIFKAISRIWKRKSKSPEITVVELFQAEIRKLKKRKQDGETFSYLSEDWRDLRMAIEECLKAGHNDEFMPYALTREFVKNRSRSKSQAEHILDEHDKLSN